MKKPSRKTLKNKLDKLAGEITRARGKCEVCGSKRELQWCHIFSRKFLNTRWDELNCRCWCASCHSKFHDSPLLMTEWVKKHLGEDNYELLKESHNLIYKPTIDDLQTKLKVLSELKEG